MTEVGCELRSEEPAAGSRLDAGPPFQLIRLPDAACLAGRLADDLAARLREAVQARGCASLAVPGGSTPGHALAALGARDLPWAQVAVTLTDERWVDPPDPGSNEDLVRRSLLKGAAGQARFVGLKTSASHAKDAIGEVERRLDGMARPFDVMLLGMGADGHFASLFPGSAALRASLAGDPAQAQAVEAPGAQGSAERITLALPTLLDSRFVALMITGEDKLATLTRAAGPGDSLDLPVRAILRGARCPLSVYWTA